MRFIRENGWKRNSVILMLIALATLLSAIAPQDRVFADDGELAAVYRNGSFEVVVPNNQGVTSNHGFSLEIVDPNDKLIAKAVRYASSDPRLQSHHSARPK